MVYDSDFYTTRRPYRSSPNYSTYTTSFEPSRQVRILPGLGKVHVVHSYDRIVPYVGHKRLTVVTSPPRVFSTRPSVLQREYDWIERRVRPSVGYSATNRYLNSDSAVRIYYSSYPISSSYCTTLSLPSSSYYPKLYRWYYDWPRTYSYPSCFPESYYYRPRSYYSPSFYFYWPYYRSYLSSYFRNYYLRNSPSIFYRSLDYEFGELENKINDLSKMIYINYPYRTIDYYPDSTRIYRPLTLYYNYYYPVRSLNYYSDVWPYYPYYRYLYYKYTLPSDRYYYLKGKIVYLPNSVTGSSYRIYPTASYIRHRTYKPLSLYCDYYEPIRALFWNSSYWPLYRSASSFQDQLPSRAGGRLQKIFDSETSLIRAQTSALLRRIHDPVPRVQRLSWPLSTVSRHYDDIIPARYSSDAYINRMLVSSPYNSKVSYTTYSTEPIRKYIGLGRLSCVSYAGSRAYNRRPHIYLYENPLQSDIQLLSYYVNKFKQEKTYSGESKLALSTARPTRKFGPKGNSNEDAKQDEEMSNLRKARAARLAFINEEERVENSASKEVDEAVRVKKEKEEASRLAEERALAEEQARQEALAKKAAQKADIARQEELAAKAAAERAAELERQVELAKQAETKKQAELERRRQEEAEERARLEDQKRLEAAKAEEALRAQLRLEEIARKAEEEREAELARQAEELAELARQEAELAEQAKKETEEEELRRQEAELEELQRQEEELAELQRQEQELAEAARLEVEIAENAQEDADASKREAETAELARQEAELEELERAQAELDALEEEAKAMESDLGPAQEHQPEAEVDEAELARQAEEEELRRQDEELAELERAQVELDALEAEAKAMEDDFGPVGIDQNDEDEDDQAIAEDVPGEQSDEE